MNAADPKYQALAKVSIFASLPRDVILSLAEACTTQDLAAGETLFREGDPPDALYVIMSGALSVHKGSVALSVRREGECIGEVALLTGEGRTASVSAQEASRVLALSAQALWQIVSQSPDSVRALFRLMASRLTQSDQARVEELQARARLQDLFSKYVSPGVVEQLMKETDPGALLKGHRHKITILVAHLSGFGALSEALSPEGVVDTLNEFLSQMIDVVFEHGGTLDKIGSDSMKVFFGAPLARYDDGRRAVACAVEMHKRMHSLRDTSPAFRGKPLKLVVGVHTGEAIAGNVGSMRRMEYTAIGDSVNLAMGLQELAREQEAPLLVSESTFQEAQGLFRMEPGKTVPIKGRRTSVMVFPVRVPVS